MSKRIRSRSARGFTLVELLVVIGIILVLIGILLPTAQRVRKAADKSSTLSLMSSIAGAAEHYHTDFKAYPGLFANRDILIPPATPLVKFFADSPTNSNPNLNMTENFVASLVGGIDPYDNAGTLEPRCQLEDAANTIGKGPMTYAQSVVRRVRLKEYIEAQPGKALPKLPYSGHGCFANEESLGIPTTNVNEKDSAFPEFWDRYSDPRPIIILRANVGTNGDPVAKPTQVVCHAADPATDRVRYQYDETQLNFYKRGASGPFIGDFVFSPTNDYPSVDAYMTNPSITTTPATVREKDHFIMISAGNDRTFGTVDDLFYGGQ